MGVPSLRNHCRGGIVRGSLKGHRRDGTVWHRRGRVTHQQVFWYRVWVPLSPHGALHRADAALTCAARRIILVKTPTACSLPSGRRREGAFPFRSPGGTCGVLGCRPLQRGYQQIRPRSRPSVVSGNRLLNNRRSGESERDWAPVSLCCSPAVFSPVGPNLLWVAPPVSASWSRSSRNMRPSALSSGHA